MSFRVTACEFIGNSRPRDSVNPNDPVWKPEALIAPILAGYQYVKYGLGLEENGIAAIHERILEIEVDVETLDAAKGAVNTACQDVIDEASLEIELRYNPVIYRPLGGGQHGIGFWIFAGGQPVAFEREFPNAPTGQYFVIHPMMIVRLQEALE